MGRVEFSGRVEPHLDKEGTGLGPSGCSCEIFLVVVANLCSGCDFKLGAELISTLKMRVASWEIVLWLETDISNTLTPFYLS